MDNKQAKLVAWAMRTRDAYEDELAAKADAKDKRNLDATKYPPYFKARMVANEREVMERLRTVTKQTGRPYNPNPVLMSNAYYNAIERLIAKRVIRYAVTKHGGGYVEVKRKGKRCKSK